MAWRDEMGKTLFFVNGQFAQLVGGSFRGIPFRTVGADVKVGRRNVVNEYPQRDTSYVDDLGRRARRFSVECYVTGPDYFAERDALVKAFETAGSGELIHPRYGSRRVAVDGEVSLKESPEYGGMCRINATFVEDGLNNFPRAALDTVAQVETATNAADEATQACFADKFSVDGPSVLASQALDGLKGLNASVAGLLATARQVTSVAGLSTIVGLVGSLSGNIAALIRTPVVLVQSLRSIYAQLVQEVERPLSAISELQAVFASNTRPTVTARSGSTRARSLTNDTARSDLQRGLALTNQARLLTVALNSTGLVATTARSSNSSTAYTSTQSLVPTSLAQSQSFISQTNVVATAEQARVLRDALVAQIDIELEMNDPPAELAQALAAVRAAVVRDVAARSEFLLNRATYTPKAVLPALVLAHRIYQDATRADELVSRNGVPHPAFMPARALEILQ